MFCRAHDRSYVKTQEDGVLVVSEERERKRERESHLTNFCETPIWIWKWKTKRRGNGQEKEPEGREGTKIGGKKKVKRERREKRRIKRRRWDVYSASSFWSSLRFWCVRIKISIIIWMHPGVRFRLACILTSRSGTGIRRCHCRLSSVVCRLHRTSRSRCSCVSWFSSVTCSAEYSFANT